MAPARTTSSSHLLQILQSTVGDEALDLTFKAMKRLSEYENFRYDPESGRLEVLLPLADEDLWVRRRRVKTLAEFLEDDEQYAYSENPSEEYTFWLAQCVHYGLEFPITTEDAKAYVRGAIEQGIKKEPPHFRVLRKFLERQYLEMHEESDESDESEESEESEVDDDDQVVFVGPEEEESGFDMVDNDCQVVEDSLADEYLEAMMIDQEHDADDEDESDDTEREDKSDGTDDDDDNADLDSESDEPASDSDADMDDGGGGDHADDTQQDGDNQDDQAQETRGVSEGNPPDINMNADGDGISGPGDNTATPDHQQCESLAPQSANEPQLTLPRSPVAAIEEVDLSQESPTSIYDLSSDSDSQPVNASNNAGQDNTEEASYDAALREHIDCLYNEDEYDNFSEYHAGHIASGINDLRSSGRATRSSAAKDESKTSVEHIDAPSLSPVCLMDLDRDLETAQMCQKAERDDNTQQKDKSLGDRKSQDLPDVEDLLPSIAHNNKSGGVKTDMRIADAPGSQDSVFESIETCSPNPGSSQTLKPVEVRDLGKSNTRDKEGPTTFYPLPSATSLRSPCSEVDHDGKDIRALPLKTLSTSGTTGFINVPQGPKAWSSPPTTNFIDVPRGPKVWNSPSTTSFINVPRGPKAWSSPCRSRSGTLSGVTAHSPLLTPSPKESRFLRQLTFQKARGAVLHGKNAASMLDSFSSVTTQSNILSSPFVQNTTFPIRSFTNQTVQNKLELEAGMNAERSEQAREHQNIVNWHQQEYQRLREVNHQNIRKEQPGAEAIVEHGRIQQSSSRAGKRSAEDNILPCSIGSHSQLADQRSDIQRSLGNAAHQPRKKQCLETPSKNVEQSTGRRSTNSSSTGKKTSMMKTHSATQSGVDGCSTQERLPRKEGSFKTPITNDAARSAEKKETTYQRPKEQNRGGQSPTKTRASKAAAAKAKSEMSFRSIRDDANQTPKSKSMDATNNLSRQLIDSRDTTSKRDEDKTTRANQESLMSHPKTSKPELAWQSVTYTSNPMAGRRPGSYRLDSIEPQHFRDVITIVNPAARHGQSLKDLPLPRKISTMDPGTEQPLELQWVEQRRAFKKRKRDQFMANVPEDSLLMDKVPIMVSEPKGLRIEHF
ncbi:hypothetical protein LTR84_010831 [Exophiala bonariae]|uniref:Uncharacterized protein n=1 Tax=Exophiala bonariae TaxID=1690606 RepID=A0AAV9NHQ3_9EURO|nr:hypothetical protein LTR84_010831 [Exophiala bonariae]